MKISNLLFSYLTSAFLNSFITVFTVIGSLVTLFDLVELLRRSGGKVNLNQAIILKMLCLRLPMHIQEILPFIIFFTAILTFWRLNRSSEIIILRTIGLSIWQFLSPLMGVALLIGLFDLIFLSPFASKMMGRFEFYETKYFANKEQIVDFTDTGIWLREVLPSEARIYRIGHIDDRKNQFYNLSVYRFNQNEQFVIRYDAEVAILSGKFLQLKSGIATAPDKPPHDFKNLSLITNLSLTKIQDSIADPRILPFWTLPYHHKQMEKSGLSGQRYLLRFHNLMAKTLWLAVMVLLAATFSLSHVRLGQTSRMIILGVICTFLLYFLREIMVTLSHVGKIPTVLGAWAPTCITGMTAITKLLYSEDG